MHTDTESKPFLGPLFIVGMPRSGTTLLKALLNQHPEISLSLTESNLIPQFVKTFGEPPPFQTQADVEVLIQRLHQTVFFQKLSVDGRTFTSKDLCENASLDSWASIFECILRHFSPKAGVAGTIWGDKTPGHINHIPLLKRLHPEAKFLHIVRDPRDYCVSITQSWGKSTYRAAHRWQSTLSKVLPIGRALNDDYLEIKYEALLSDTENVMRRIADFVGRDYHPDTTHIERSPENTGSTTGVIGIVKDNMNKYNQYFSPKDIRRIEEIVCDCAKQLDYPLENPDVRYRPLSRWVLPAYKLHDGLPSLKHHIFLSNSVTKGIRRLLTHYPQSSWR